MSPSFLQFNAIQIRRKIEGTPMLGQETDDNRIEHYLLVGVEETVTFNFKLISVGHEASTPLVASPI